jgi:sugar lactone lactonase YvrE
VLVHPPRAVEGGRLVLYGSGLAGEERPVVTIGDTPAHVSFSSPRRLVIEVPSELEGGDTPVRVGRDRDDTASVSIGRAWATGLHQVDSPVFDAEGRLYVTYSGTRGQEAPVSIFRVTRQGTREPYASGIVNATSMTIGPDGALYVSSRFEGAVYRVREDGAHDAVAGDLGVACGLAFDRDGWLYVGDRSGTIFRVRNGAVSKFATLPPSVAAFHLAMSPDGDLYVAAPTLAPYDHVYRIDRQGEVTALPFIFGRPQGVAFDAEGALHVVEALAGASGVYRVGPDGPELRISGGALIGIAFGPHSEVVVASNETAYRFDFSQASG